MAINTWDADFYDSKHSFVSKYGNDVIELLAPQSNEVILDLGCGSGDLTAKISNAAKKVIGIDSAKDMIDKANTKYPDIEFHQHNAEHKFPFTEKFDAIFSNAALHWMLDAQTVARNIADALKIGGRFVFEMGGKGNINTILEAIREAGNKFKIKTEEIFNFFPSIGEYANILEKQGLSVKLAVMFERPTILEGNDGLRNWIKMFRSEVVRQIEVDELEKFFSEVEIATKDKLYKNNNWTADYVRLRMVAIKNNLMIIN